MIQRNAEQNTGEMAYPHRVEHSASENEARVPLVTRRSEAAKATISRTSQAALSASVAIDRTFLPDPTSNRRTSIFCGDYVPFMEGVIPGPTYDNSC